MILHPEAWEDMTKNKQKPQKFRSSEKTQNVIGALDKINCNYTWFCFSGDFLSLGPY